MGFTDLKMYRIKFKNSLKVEGLAGIVYLRYKDTFLATDRIKQTYMDGFMKRGDCGN